MYVTIIIIRQKSQKMIQNQYIFTRLITTKFYHYCVLVQIILTLALAVLVVKGFQKSYILEIFLASMMSVDILIRYLGSKHQQYWQNFWNKCDLLILTMLVFLFVLETIFTSVLEIQEIQIAIIAIRTLSQLYRMFRLIKQEKDSRLVQSLEPVDLSFDQQNFVQKFH